MRTHDRLLLMTVNTFTYCQKSIGLSVKRNGTNCKAGNPGQGQV